MRPKMLSTDIFDCPQTNIRMELVVLGLRGNPLPKDNESDASLLPYPTLLWLSKAPSKLRIQAVFPVPGGPWIIAMLDEPGAQTPIGCDILQLV